MKVESSDGLNSQCVALLGLEANDVVVVQEGAQFSTIYQAYHGTFFMYTCLASLRRPFFVMLMFTGNDTYKLQIINAVVDNPWWSSGNALDNVTAWRGVTASLSSVHDMYILVT